MSNEARRAAVAALIRLAGSSDYRDRADAGRGLASLAETPETQAALLDLLLDTEDTFVTRVTAEALLRRQDRAGLAVVAAALGAADLNHADWMHTAVMDVFGVLASDRDAAVRECEALTKDTDDRIRHGAHQLIDMLAELNPILSHRETTPGIPVTG
ncbi:hypothetical protein [Couchioplanes caeruleus]|uniref:HEAT repeat protein n=2 Tax=Couchioplanes caeruleus TaxID=56438 RepID=A0A1K0GPB2_9ACTN|nr:hypothetical protein [Couchioplanes caeruleus]OJF12956.1 hypothetical protein BG844_17865 [Couchioplanes caeruleus subsp. caeruleus]ROP33655.1 hypothetical protein EDD30_6681 [Couchioplanes caeruleus]